MTNNSINYVTSYFFLLSNCKNVSFQQTLAKELQIIDYSLELMLSNNQSSLRLSILLQLKKENNSALMLPTILILTFLIKRSFQATKSAANPYLDSFRSGYVRLPMTTVYFTNQTFTTAYQNQLLNSSALQCYAFLSSFQIKFNGFYLDQTIAVYNCSSSSVSISSSSFGQLSQTIAYLTICNRLVGTPNFMVLQLFASNGPTIASLNNLNTTGQVRFFNFMVYSFFYVCIDRQQDDSVAYGFKFVVNKYNSTSLNYSILFQGNSKSSDFCYFNYGYRFLVIIMNEGFFSYGETIMISGSVSSYSNLQKQNIMNVLGSYSSGLYTLAGLSGLYSKQGGSKINFYYQEKTNGLMTINSTIEKSSITFNYITFPTQIKIPDEDPPKNDSSTKNNTNNDTNNNNTNNNKNNNTNNNSSSNNGSNTNNNTNNNNNSSSNNGSNTNNNTNNNSSSNNGSNTNNNSSGNNSNNSNNNQTSNQQAKFLSLGKIMAFSACAVVFTGVLLTFICCFCRKKEQKKEPELRVDEPITSKSLITTNIFSQSPKIQRQTCCICNLERIEMTTPCFHYFHIKCLKQHLSQSQICVICQKSLKDDKFAAICAKCTNVIELTLQQVKNLSSGAEDQMICNGCEGKTQSKENEIKTEKLQQLWLQYGISLADQVVTA